MNNWFEAGVHPDLLGEIVRDAYTVIDLDGTARENGRVHGDVASAKIRRNIEIVESVIAAGKSVDFESRFWQLIDANAQFICRTEPEIGEEVFGISEGAGIDVRYAWTLAIPAHVILLAVESECTQVLVKGDRTLGRSTILAKTRDFHDNDDYEQVFLRHRYPEGTVISAMHTAGSVTYPGAGITSHGVGFASSGVFSPFVTDDPSRADNAWITFNAQPIARAARSAADFITRCNGIERFRGINMLVADAETASAVQLTGTRVVDEPSTEDYLQLTNHYQSADAELNHLTPKPHQAISSYARAACARTVLSSARSWTRRDVAELLGSHEGYPNNSLCRHVDPDHAGSSGKTVTAAIVRVDDLSLAGVFGNPCSAPLDALAP